MKYPVTPDGRYFVVRGRLWRVVNTALDKTARSEPVSTLITARRAVRAAKKTGAPDAEAAAHRAVDEAKRALGERSPAWWDGGSPDVNRHMAKNTPYADWYGKIARIDAGGTIRPDRASSAE
ncbi:MAG: hypothetical protein WDN50_02240 [Bradyrhizobium sp.]